MKQTLLAVSLILPVFLLVSCQKDKEPFSDPTIPGQPDPSFNIADYVRFEEGTSLDDARISLVHESILLSDTTLERSPCQKYAAWTKVAEVASIEYQGDAMSTTFVALSDKVAVISYHVAGPTHYGVLETIDLASPNNPSIKSKAFFMQADVNAVVLEKEPAGNEQKVWVALSDGKDGAVLGELILKNKKFQNNYRQIKLAYELDGSISASANAIAEAGNYLYVTAGRSNGGVFCIDKTTFTVVGVKQFANAKGVAVNGGITGESAVCALQTYGEPRMRIGQVGFSDFPVSFPIAPITHQSVEDELGGKIAMAFAGEGSNLVFFTSGKNGIKGYDISTGTLVFETPSKMLSFGNANGLSFDDHFMYVANGAEGLAVFPLDEFGIPDPASTFIWDLDEPVASANFVATDQEWTFIAKGAGGFKILKKPSPADYVTTCGYDNDGVPHCLSNDVTVCSSLSDRLDTALPVGEEAQDLHPEYFSTGASEILLQANTKLRITFIGEHTERQNSIGYYFYSDDCPPSSASELNGMIAFMNFSESGSGGKLETGQTLKLPGQIKAGTRIGFFLVKDGWDNGSDIYYTNPAFNSDGKKHGLLFYDSECGDIIVAFHDDKLPKNDADFRDVVFKITPDFQVAFPIVDFLQL